MSDITVEVIENTIKHYRNNLPVVGEFVGRALVVISESSQGFLAGDSDGAISANFWRKHKRLEDWHIKKWEAPVYQDNRRIMRLAKYADVLDKAAKAKKAAGESATNPIKGKTFVFTGTLQGGTRTSASDRVIRAGGNVSNNVTRKTDYVVVGSGGNGTDKERSASILGVVKLSEDAFAAMVRNAGFNW